MTVPRNRNSRAAIQAAARQEFVNHGFAGARVARIAAAAGVNKQLIFYYFGSKSGLYDHVRSQLAGVYSLAPLDSKGSAELARTLKQHVERAFSYLSSDPDVIRLYLHEIREGSSPVSRGLSHLVVELTEAVTVGQGMGRIRDDLEPDYVARQIVLMLLGYFILEPTLFDSNPAARERWFDGTWSLIARWVSW